MQQIRQGQQARPRLVAAFRKRGREGRPADRAAQLAPARVLSVGLRALSATVLALLALATVDAAGAAAAPGWLSPVNLFAAGQNALTPQVAVDSQDDAVAVWQRDGDRGGSVQAASHEAAARWRREHLAEALYADVENPKEVRLMLLCRGDSTPNSRCWVDEVKLFVTGRELFLRHKLIGKRRWVNIDGRSRRFVDVKLNRWGRELMHKTHKGRIRIKVRGRGVVHNTVKMGLQHSW